MAASTYHASQRNVTKIKVSGLCDNNGEVCNHVQNLIKSKKETLLLIN